MGVPVDSKTGNPLGNVPQILQFQNNFIPAQATTIIQYSANLPTLPKTNAKSHRACRHPVSRGRLQPRRFTQNPLPIGTPAVPFGDTTMTGSAATNKASRRRRSPQQRQLSGAAPSNSVATNFIVGDTITVNGTVITFVATGAAGNQLNVTDTVGTCSPRSARSRAYRPPSAATGAITLHTGTAQTVDHQLGGADGERSAFRQP